jgi:hypothetical protein
LALGDVDVQLEPARSAARGSISATSRTIRSGRVGPISSSSLPASTRDRSRMSLMTAIRCSPLRRIVARCSSCSVLSLSSSSISAKPRIAVIGVRISWLMCARNSLLAWLARLSSTMVAWLIDS